MRICELRPQDWVNLHQSLKRALKSKFSTFNMDDVVQQTSLLLLDKAHSKDFESLEHLTGYSILIARNWCLNEIRRGQRMVVTPQMPEESYNFCEEFIDLYRHGVSLYLSQWLEGYTLQEIGEMAQKGTSTIHKSLTKELTHLRQQWS